TSAARINAPDRVKSLEVGADAYLVEPAEEEELIGTVRALLKLAQHERDNQRLIERLTESEMRYRSLIERMPAAMYTIDRHGRITFYNDQAAELWGRRPNLGDSESQFRGSYKLLWPDGTALPHDKTPMADAVQDGTALHGQDVILERSDGTRRHVIVHIDPLRNAEGHIVGAVNLFTDITVRKQAEDALRDAERRYRTIFEQAGVGVAQINSRTGRFERVNRKYCEIVERTEAEMLATTFMSITHPDDLAEDLAGMERLRCGLTDSIAMEKRYVRKDGSIVWVLLNVAPLRKLGEELSQHIAVVQDITERKHAEERLRENEERFRMLAEAMPHFVWHTDEQGETEFENQRWYDYTGLTHETTRHGGWFTVQHPDDAPRLADAWKKAVETGGEYDVETRFRRDADGAYRWFRVRGAPVRDAEGRIRSWVGTCTDIHDRKEAELALRESEERYRATFANAAVGIAHIGLDGRWLQFNDSLCTITGYFREELLTMTFVDITSPGDLKTEWVQARRMLAGEIETYSMEKRYVRKDGSLIWVNKTVSLLRDACHRPLHFICIIEDIDDRKQAEEALREAQARLYRWNVELEQAVNMKTAELRQSQDHLRALTSELNLAEQRERKRLATELHDHLQQMLVVGKLTIGQGKRAAIGVPACETVLKKVDDILSDALTYSRTLVAELSPPVLRDHGLTASLKWLAEYMKKKHEQTVAVVVLDDQGLNLPEDQRVLLFQSVRELLINSAKHAGTGQAALTMEKRADHLCITVKDEGKGFDLAAAAAAGVPSGGISSKFGLYSIQERMRALGGSFTIDSAPGHGTVATLILPLVRSADDNQPQPSVTESEDAWATVPADEADSLTNGRMMVSVLLVDDHAMVRQGLRSVLDAYADIQIIGEARDGVEAVKSVEKLRPQVVVMDINMPKMNGIEATMEIKTKWPETTIIGISVNVGDDNNDAMQRAGAVTLLTKEAAVEQLHDTIVQAVGSQDTQGGSVIPR
ncbi:MAG TPA: PAS domain S-box protein, partial [Nitrospira sp.]|nr:PAS domain S-box protein [Nitrospira sp.]